MGTVTHEAHPNSHFARAARELRAKFGDQLKTPKGCLGQGEREKQVEDLKGRRWRKVL